MEPGTILPFATCDMILRFQSNSSGVFSEDWQLISTPQVTGTHPILSLCGVTESVEDFSKTARPFKVGVEKRQLEAMVRGMLHHVITNLAPRPRPPTPEERWRRDKDSRALFKEVRRCLLARVEAMTSFVADL